MASRLFREGVQGEGAAFEPPCLAQPVLTRLGGNRNHSSFPLRPTLSSGRYRSCLRNENWQKLENFRQVREAMRTSNSKMRHVSSLLRSLYPHLDLAVTQSRTDSGVHIRDLVFYNNRSHPFLNDIFGEYDCKQIVMELKNVAKLQILQKDHVDQLNRYMDNEVGKFGVLVTRNPVPKSVFRNTIDLWSGQRRAIIVLNDEGLAQMVELFESKQRSPIDVVNKKYREFRRSLINSPYFVIIRFASVLIPTLRQRRPH